MTKHAMKKKKGGNFITKYMNMKREPDIVSVRGKGVKGGFSFGDFVNAVNPVNIVKDRINDVKLLVTDPVKFVEHPSKYISFVPGVGMLAGTVASQGLKTVGLGKKKGGDKAKKGGSKIRRMGVGAV